MNKPKKLLLSDIRYECGDSSFERGRSYFIKNQVVHLTVKSEGALYVQLNASVKGSMDIPYKQNIRIIWRPDFSSTEIEGHCSCPMGYNCKHVAAVCLQYQNSGSSPSVKEPSCLDWLDSFNEQMPEPRDTYQEFIVYVLKPSSSAYELTVDFIITKEKKTGGFAKGRKTNLNNLRYSYSYTNYIQSQDVECAKLLAILNTSTGQPLLAGAVGFLALSKMLDTGRLFWLDIDTPSLRSGANRDLQFTWQQLEQGDFRLKIYVDPEATPLVTDPPLYLDSVRGTIGGINGNKITGNQLKRFLDAPTIPGDQADEFSFRLAVEYPQLHLPPPKKLTLTEVENLIPSPRLLLFGQQISSQHYAHFMTVGFNYAEWTVSTLDSEDFSVIKTDAGLVRIKRALENEQQAMSQLAELGFEHAPVLEKDMKQPVFFSPAEKTTVDSAARWGHFLESTRPELEEAGWTIEIDDSYLLNFQSAQHWEAEISEGRNDWFEMRFNIELDGQSLPLLPLIMPVLESYDLEDLPETLIIPLGSHQYLNVASDKIRPFLAVLYELFGSSTLSKDGSLKLSRFNAASLAELEEHSYGLFSLRGGAELRALGQKLKNFSGIDDVALPVNLQAELRHYQQHGLNWLQFLREYQFAGILADDMGLGKTIQTLAHLLLEKQSGRMTAPCLIIAPTSLMSNWRREAQRFTPDLTVLTLQGTERKQHFDKINHYDLILTTYPLLSRDEETLVKHDYYYLILDEAQVIKNPLAKAAQIVRQLTSMHRLCLTGTPMENHLGELWAQFDFLMPGFLGDSATFKRLYRTPIEIHGSTQQKSRLSRRVAPFMLRRTKQEVAKELPLKTEIIRTVPLYPKQAALYESIRLTMEKKVRDAIAEKGLSRSHITILDALLKLRQTCCDPRTLPLSEAQKIKESAKLDLLMDLLPEQLEEGRRILVFSQFTRMIALIEEKLKSQKIGYSKLTGQTRHRDEAIELFKSGAVNVFLISLKAGGVGLNLTEADTVIIYDPWWNPAVESQAADRAHRIGQDKPVFVYKLITENTVEEKILAMQDRKRLLAESIYQSGGKEESFKLTADDLTALFEPL
jgi:superfamily II DNA or RNA helicase